MKWILIEGQHLYNTTVANNVAKELNANKVQFVADYYGCLSVFVDDKLAWECHKVAPLTWRVPVHLIAEKLVKQVD